MRKIISMVLALATAASLAISASAHSNNTNFVEHSRTDPCLDEGLWGTHCFYLQEAGAEAAIAERYEYGEKVQVLSISDNATQYWTYCPESISTRDLRWAAEDFNGVGNCNPVIIEHMTVFRQRYVEAEGEVELSVRLWDVGPKNRAVILFKGPSDYEWAVLNCGELGSKDCSAVLPGSGDYVVAMTW